MRDRVEDKEKIHFVVAFVDGIEFQIEFLIGLLGVVALLAQLARMVNVPYPIFLVLGGLGVGLVPGLPEIELPPEVIFLVFLPPLILSVAFFSSPRDLRAHARPIGLLALGLVILTTAAVAAVAHYAANLPWGAAFVLGAIVSPTDPVAAEAVYRRLGTPERIGTIIGGESVINDGTALVVYRIAVGAAVGGSFSLLQGSLDFVLLSAGGIVLGLVVGWLVAPIYSRLNDTAILVTVTLIPAYAVYVVAERIGVSGILAVAALGLYVGWQAPKRFTAQTRLQGYSFWEVLVFLLDSLLFVLIGLQFPSILESLGERSAWEVLLYAALVCATVVGLRLLWFFTVPRADPLLDRILPGTYPRTPWKERLVMSWSGMRGAISLAAALSLPLTIADGAPFPGRDLIIFLTVCVIFVTLVVQGLTLPLLIVFLRVTDDGHDTRMEELRARLGATHAALDTLERLGEEEKERVSASTRRRLRDLYEERLGRYRAGLQAGRITEEYQENSMAWRHWRRELFAAERAAVVSLRDEGKISAEVMRRVERDIDLEELRFGG